MRRLLVASLCAIVLAVVVTNAAGNPVVARNVRDFGAKGDGVTDDSAAFIRALTQGRADQGPDTPFGPGVTYSAGTTKAAYVFVPAGTYIITQTLPIVYYTQFVGDDTNGAWPTIIFRSDSTQDTRVLEVAGQWYTGVNQDNFYRQIRNFVIDTTQCRLCTSVHWQVAQATSISQVWFKQGKGSNNQGMWMENGSGGFFADLIFDGGKFGLWVGNQQFTSRNITIRDASVSAIYLNWDWVWTFQGLQIENTPVGIDLGGGTGSLVVIDSTFRNCNLGIRTRFDNSSGYGNNSLAMDNVAFQGFAPGSALVSSGSTVLLAAPAADAAAPAASTSWVQGFVWENQATRLTSLDISARLPARPAALLGSNGKWFQAGRPSYTGQSILDVSTVGVVGDGKTDITSALINAIKTYGQSRVLFFPHGIYLISNTIHIPGGTRMVGQAWSVLMASGQVFTDPANPVSMLQVGSDNEKGVAQLVDFMISTRGPQRGAKLIDWRIAAPAGQQSASGMWDVHFRIGGAVGTNMQMNNCPKGDGSSAPVSQCGGAYMLMHVQVSGSLYMENVWGWVADHDIDTGKQGAQINIYNARGFLCESQGPVWMYGTAMEHSYLYQYSFVGARNVFMGAIQTETAYFQPSTNTPWDPNPSVHDPSFCTDDPRCRMSLALSIQMSNNIWAYGTGLYSFFNVWDQACLTTSQGPVCQRDLVQIDNGSHSIVAIALNTYGSEYMNTKQQSYTLASRNKNTFCSGAIIDLNHL